MNLAVLAQKISRLLLPGVAYGLLTACGGGGGLAGIGGGSGGFVLEGSVGDGPIVSATITVRSSSGTVLGTTVSNENADFSISLSPDSGDFPLTIETTGGVDLVTKSIPDFDMVSVVLNSSQTRANINPFSTLIVKSAQAMSGGLSNVNIASAQITVLNKLNFGFDMTLASSPITASVTGANVAMIVKTSESLAEMIRRTRDTLGGGISADDVVASLAADLSDGVMDGVGATGASALTSAIANVVSGQVLLEALSNNLKVGGISATALMDDAIKTALPSAPSTAVTDNVWVTAEMLVQAITAINAAVIMDSDVALTNIVNDLSGISEGDFPADISVFQSPELDTAISLVAVANDSQITAVNTVSNNPPTISGSPGAFVAEGSFYSFTPGANDADGDTLAFSVTNRPAWTSFNTSTGALTGTPGFSNAGTYNNIIISVSDGYVTTSLNGFGVTVSNTNITPIISGSPSAFVTEVSFYSFIPSANDVDGDELVFSITNKPVWASFNTSTGALTGTPGVGDAGTYGGIIISVSDGTATATLSSFGIDVNAGSATGVATLSWTPPTTKTDGSGLDDLSGYKIRYGTSSGSYPNEINVGNAGIAAYVVENLPSNTYYFVVTAYNTSGVESTYSNEVSKIIQ